MGEINVEGKEVCGLEEEEAAWLRVIELGSLCCVPMALKAAIQLKVMDILASAHPLMLSSPQIVSHLNPSSNPRASISLDRILRLLASHGVLTSSHLPSTSLPYVPTYGLNAVSSLLVNNGDSLAPMVLLNQDKVLMDSWHFLHQAVLDGGQPFSKAHGKDAFSYGRDDPRFDNLFNSAMSNHTKLLLKSLLDTYSGFDDVSTLVDVGGGLGSCLSMIISKHPHIKGINFDQPHVVAAAPEYPGNFSQAKYSFSMGRFLHLRFVLQGVENVGGDMFVSVPQADAIFMKWILHDWSDEHCVEILKNCYKALPNQGGKVIVLDAILPPLVESGARARVGYHIDVLMFAYNQGGRERTHQELLTISKLAGFAHMQVVSKLNECSVVELYKV